MFVLTNSDFAEKKLVCYNLKEMPFWTRLFVVQLIYTWFFIYSIHLFIYEYLNNYYVILLLKGSFFLADELFNFYK